MLTIQAGILSRCVKLVSLDIARLKKYRENKMTTKIKAQKNGAWTVFEKLSSGMYLVKLYRPHGHLEDKIICDDYTNARAYLASFNRIAKIY